MPASTRLLIVLIVLVSCAPPARAQALEGFEPGVRLQLYWIGEDFDDLLPLAPGQSPNVDVTIQGLDIHGDEAYFLHPEGEPYTSRYVLDFTTALEIVQGGTYVFRLVSNRRTEMQAQGRHLIGNPDGGSYAIEATADLEAGLHPVRIQTFAAKIPAEVQLTWRPPGTRGFTPVPDSVFFTRARSNKAGRR